MAELKTQPNKRKSVTRFLESISHEKRKQDAFELLKIMKRVTKKDPIMWGESIIGFGSYDYKRKNDTLSWFPVGFSPRKAALVFYSTPWFPEFKDMVAKLGKIKSSVSCIYISDLDKIDKKVLEALIKKSMQASKHIKAT